jgi:hypothetical protein
MILCDDDSISSQESQATAFTIPGDWSSAPVTLEQAYVPPKAYADALQAPPPKVSAPKVGPPLAAPKAAGGTRSPPNW